MTDEPPDPIGEDDSYHEPLETIRSPYFEGTQYRDRVELTITRREMTDDDNLSEFGDALNTACEQRQACRILIDVSRLEYVTSSILSKFITLNRKMTRGGGCVVLAAPSSMFREVLEMTNLNDYFQVSKTVEAARAKVRERGDN